MKMVGIGQWSECSLYWSFSPDIPGIFISVITHPVSCCWPQSKKASAELKDCTESPADFSNRWTASRYDSSSSITATILFFLSPAIHIQDRAARVQTAIIDCHKVDDIYV